MIRLSYPIPLSGFRIPKSEIVLASPLQLSPSIRLAPQVQLSRSVNAREAQRAALARQHYARRSRVISKFHTAIGRQLDYARTETLRNVDDYIHTRLTPNSAICDLQSAITSTSNASAAGVAADIIFDLDRFEQGFFMALRNQSADALQTAGAELYEEIGLDDVWRMPDPLTLDFLSQRRNLLKDVPQEIWNDIRGEIVEGLEEGDSIDQLSKRINRTFSVIDSGRGKMIASTETGAAYGYSRDKAMRIAGVRYKKWLTSHLDNVRPAHAAAENQRVRIDEPFVVGGERLMYPGDPNGSAENVINCHCVSLAELPEELKAA